MNLSQCLLVFVCHVFLLQCFLWLDTVSCLCRSFSQSLCSARSLTCIAGLPPRCHQISSSCLPALLAPSISFVLFFKKLSFELIYVIQCLCSARSLTCIPRLPPVCVFGERQKPQPPPCPCIHSYTSNLPQLFLTNWTNRNVLFIHMQH